MAAKVARILPRIKQLPGLEYGLLHRVLQNVHHHSFQCCRLKYTPTQKRRSKNAKPVAGKFKQTTLRLTKNEEKVDYAKIPDPEIDTDQRLQQLRRNEKLVFLFSVASAAFFCISYFFIFTDSKGEKIRKRNEARMKAWESQTKDQTLSDN